MPDPTTHTAEPDRIAQLAHDLTVAGHALTDAEVRALFADAAGWDPEDLHAWLDDLIGGRGVVAPLPPARPVAPCGGPCSPEGCWSDRCWQDMEDPHA